MCSFRIVAAFFLQAALVGGLFAAEIDDAQHGSPQALFPGVTYASIATESEKPTSEAPAVISVITAEDLHNHGITSLEQALEEIPGVYSPYRFLNGHFVIRGVHTSPLATPEVLFLIDGVPQHDIWASTLQFFITRIPIGNIKRIEIIRGPGSAIYGADAFAGVINVITKTDKDYDANEFRGRLGSYDTKEIDAVLKGKVGNVNALLSMQLRGTDGHRPLITEDAQTYFDGLFSTSVSLAPGEADTYFDEYNISLDIFGEFWRSRFQIRDHELGLGLGLFEALTEEGKGFGKFYNIDIFYDRPAWSDDWQLKARVNLFDSSIGANPMLLPQGAFGGTFPEGILADNKFRERQMMIDIRAIFSGFGHHEIMLATGFTNQAIHDVHEKTNFRISPDGVVTHIAYKVLPPDDTSVPIKSRQIKYVVMHDDWNITRDFIFSLGARYDDYSDFGGTFNPRLALIWLTTYDITTKLIANRAFRAPLFLESSNNENNLAYFLKGDPSIGPTIINTIELAVEKRIFNGSKINLSIFTHAIEDNIEFLPPNASGIKQVINSPDDITGDGAEIELIIPFSRDIKLKTSYSYQDNKREGSTTSTIFTAGPHHKIYTGIDWRFKRNWNLYTNILWVDDFTRDVEDPRDDLGSNTFVSAVLGYTSPGKRWDTYLSVRNIFDEQAVSPTNSYQLLPNDIPLPGTNYMVEIRYHM